VKSLAHPADAAGLLQRLRNVRADNPRRWGRMTAHQMVCHLRDAFVMGTAEKPVSDAATILHRTIIKWAALYGPFRWPAGIATRPEVDQAIGGTPPKQFDADVAALAATIEAVCARPEVFRDRRHPIFGPMSIATWLRWGYLHVDHHLRQFGA
jgi:hypothetical protein